MDEDLRAQALRLWEEGTRLLESGRLDAAISAFTRSIDVFPTAEAYTFRGWAYSFQDRIDEAIAECRKAIETDPSFGNPYNDIGAYLIRQGKLDEAIPWLERATVAERYEARAFPWTNLGRIYAARGETKRAVECFRKALDEQPGAAYAQGMLERLVARRNGLAQSSSS
ncbi:MAG TPA: tetratricopeptide repeat protein [Chloroflexota bacterium]|nr:tetratricopeptide repeat protein [Chloroflexota bacterium]